MRYVMIIDKDVMELLYALVNNQEEELLEEKVHGGIGAPEEIDEEIDVCERALESLVNSKDLG